MKTYETLKWGKGYYLMIRVNGMAQAREWYKTKAELNVKVKALKAQGYVVA